MGKREYSQEMLRVWKKEIDAMEKMVSDSRSVPDESYLITLDPEDFLDLCCGKWGVPNAGIQPSERSEGRLE